MKETLETYQVTQYGEYACSCCKKPLIGKCLAVAYESDEEGHYWRTLHTDCYKDVVEEYSKALTENANMNYISLEQYIYENYPISPLVE